MQRFVDYPPITGRPKIRWPNDARVALWLVPEVTHYEYLPTSYPRIPHPPDLLTYARQDYGKRVGFWRMLEVLDKYHIRATASLNVAVLDHFPEVREAMIERDWAFISHGIYNTRSVWGLSEDEERDFWKDVVETVFRWTGKQIKGNVGPGPQSSTANTLEMMVEAGLTYHVAWLNEDEPFPLNVKNGKLISLPYTFEINDKPRLTETWEGEDMVRVVKHQFDQLYAEGAESGKVMTISLHPYMIGQPHRIKDLDQALDYVLSHDRVWVATGDEIAAHYMTHYYDQAVASLRGQGVPGR